MTKAKFQGFKVARFQGNGSEERAADFETLKPWNLETFF
jgi:hypothetical protein